MSKTYWRSLGQLADSPEYWANLEREFPEGASELPEGISRREMITLLGASLSLAGLAGCRRPEEHIVPFVNAPEEIVPGIPRRYATTLTFDRSAYGVVVESHEGRPTKVEGNELHPETAGRSSVRMQASILDLYDPDRAQTVLHTGTPSTWADFTAAWGALEKAHLADGGASLALLTGSSSSPTRARLLGLFRARFPHARVVTRDPIGDDRVRAGVRTAAGKDLIPVFRLENARVILSLGADLLGTDPDSVRNIAGFSAGRRAGIDGAPMNRLWCVEPTVTLTGAMADHRLPLSARLVPSLLAALASRLGLAAGAQVALPVVPGSWIDALAKDLGDNRGSGLVVAGSDHPPAVHAAVLALNAALGNLGRTVTLHDPAGVDGSSDAALAELSTAMTAGSVATLVLLGANPVYDAPAELLFTAAFKKVATTIALATHVDESARAATWTVPLAHPFESWEDARSPQGTLSVVQPLILPLFGGKTAAELLALLATGKEQPGRDLVRETWKPILGEADFDRRFNHVLHDGLLAGSASAPVVAEVGVRHLAELARETASIPPTDAGLEVVFRPASYLHDGRFANNGWLQELPDPITKLTWDNPALVSPATAARLEIQNEDLIRVTLGGRSVTLPAWIVPGQAEGTIALTLGYGRSGIGRVADGVGCDVYPLRTTAAPGSSEGATVAKVSGTSRQAATQEHGSMEGRPLIREGTLRDYKRDPGFAKEASEVPELVSLWTEKPYDAGHQWGMTIDLNACVGCNACVVACQSENNIPVVGKDQVRRGRQMHWIRVDRYFAGEPEHPELIFQPVPCMQCENAPCEQVCPVAATVHDDEGLNVMVYNRCIGTRYCSNNCPYKVRRFNFFNFTKDTPELVKLAQNPDVTVRSRGVMEKCTYCVQRINAAKLDARLASRELADGDVKTACQQSCPASAIEFGDLRDAGSRVVKAKKDPRSYAILAELNTKPRTTYLAKVRNPHPDLEGA